MPFQKPRTVVALATPTMPLLPGFELLSPELQKLKYGMQSRSPPLAWSPAKAVLALDPWSQGPN